MLLDTEKTAEHDKDLQGIQETIYHSLTAENPNFFADLISTLLDERSPEPL